MATVEECLEHADELAQRVVNAWAGNVDAGHRADITDEYNALFEKANAYQISKRTADNRRKINILGEQEAAAETTTRQAFAEAYKTFHDNHEAA